MRKYVCDPEYFILKLYKLKCGKSFEMFCSAEDKIKIEVTMVIRNIKI